jgi:hypothetical protein
VVFVIRELGGVYQLYPILPPGAFLCGVDLMATPLALASRAGPIHGDECRAYRDELAHLVEQLAGGGPIAELLRSRLPLRVDDPPGCWSFEFFDQF